MAFMSRLRTVALLFLLLPHTTTAEYARLIDVRHDASFDPPAIDDQISDLFAEHSAPAAQYAVDIYVMRYQSLYPDDTVAPITAQLFVPRPEDAGPRPLYVFAPGTTGLVDACRPSREHIAGIHWGLYRQHLLAFAGQGVIGLLPDYTGFGDPEQIQPLFHARSHGRMMLDGVRTVDEFLKHEAPDLTVLPGAFLAGFSQGGHAAFAAADLRKAYAAEVTLAGIIAYGPTTDLQTLFREFPVVAPMVVHVFSRLYGIDAFDPRRILKPQWLEQLERHVTRQCIGAMQSFYPWSAFDLFRPDFYEALMDDRLEDQFPAIHAILQRNSSGLSRHGVPALILQGGDDIVISAQSQRRFVERLRAAGSRVDFRLYEESRHDTRQQSFTEVLRWIGDTSGADF